MKGKTAGQQEIPRIVLEFKRSLKKDIRQTMPVYAREYLRGLIDDSDFHPGLFAAFACGAASKSFQIPKVALEYSKCLEYIHMSRLLQNSVYDDFLCRQVKSEIFQILLSRLSAGAQGLLCMAELNRENPEKRSEMLGITKGLCDSEIRSINARMRIVECVKNARAIELDYEHYISLSAPRIIRQAIAAGNSVGGRKSGRQVLEAGDLLSVAFAIWSDHVKFSRYINGMKSELGFFEALPQVMLNSDEKLLSALRDSMVDHVKVPDELLNPDVLFALNLRAEKYYETGIEKLGSGKDNLVGYAEYCRHAIKKDAGI